jgi:hypothetical protein
MFVLWIQDDDIDFLTAYPERDFRKTGEGHLDLSRRAELENVFDHRD